MEKSEFEKLLAEVDTVPADDMDEVSHGGFVDTERWGRYQSMVKVLLTAQDKCNGKIVKIDYREYPDPQSEYVSAMVVFPKASWFTGEAKEALILAAGLAEHVTMTTNGDQVRISLSIDNIWTEGEV